ncbi:hypothetical protein UPYG_G00308000 [Umbra pygmaea]|uniref:C2H2-type domain-containing protein n=1 Tax=Umbra pygmaea TaxID=75934 RepID=A0ABD0WG06_UMBPY
MELSFPENEVHVEQEVLENDLEPRVSFKPQHRELAKYVNMGHPNGVYAERPYKYKPDTIVQPSVAEPVAEPSVAKCLDVEPPVLKLLGVKPSEPIDGKHLVFKCPGLDPVEVETSDSQPSDSQVLQGPSIQTDPELDGPAFEMEECPLKMFHIYSKNSKGTDANELPLTEGDVTAVEVEMEPNTQGEDTPPDKAPVDFKHLRFHCSHCQKLYKGGNVVRHTLAHLKLRQTRLSCVFCAKQFRRYNHAKEHVLEHIEELRTSILSSKIKPAVNGDSKPSQDVGQPSEKETKPRDGVTDPKVVKAKPVVSKQTRILQNLRTLIKKTQNLKCKKDSDNQPSSEVKEEQVTVKDKVVIVRDLETDTDNRGGEEVEGKQKQYHLCPAEGCASVFARIGPSLLKHAANYHMDDSAVLEKTFQWGKGKCLICQRCFLVLEHYRDHMKVHNAPLKQACLHLNCGQRFKTLQELKDHVDTHQPLQAPCGYAGCEKVFFNILSLHDHEWRHYTQPQAKEELIAPRALRPGDEALWKCRTKSLDMAEQGWRGQTETHSLKTRHLNPYERCFHCNRYLWNHQHFFDHIKIHDAPLKQMCLHLDCGQRFSTPHLLREHMDTHRPLRALCGYSGCGLTFSYLPSLQEHEWKHYSDHKLTEVLSSTKEEQTAEFDTNGIDSPVETSGPVHVVATTTPSLHPIIKILNGCDGEDNKNVSPEAAFAAATTTSQVTTNAVPLPRIPSIIKETVNMREVEDVTLAQVILGGKEPVIVEHKTFKPEDPLYLSMAKAPLARPPPSSYLSEEALSMRKRGNSEEAPVGVLAKKTKIAVKKVLGKKIVTEEIVVKVEPPPPKRQRCSKCFSSFMSPEDLEKHLSQNTCSSLFSFDSDDDS